MDVVHIIRGFLNVQEFVDGLSTPKRPCPEFRQTKTGNLRSSAFLTTRQEDMA